MKDKTIMEQVIEAETDLAVACFYRRMFRYLAIAAVISLIIFTPI